MTWDILQYIAQVVTPATYNWSGIFRPHPLSTMTTVQDSILLSDISFVPQLERILPQCPCIKTVIFLTDRSVEIRIFLCPSCP